ncbi:hypothetical protein F4861DRAFT_547567 [Xylaria intraflava]|nr:hypothetical protein F4861DRAFT_547567 [Xylaria intraflava]
MDNQGHVINIQLMQLDGQEVISATIGEGKQLKDMQIDTQMAPNLSMEGIQGTRTFPAGGTMTGRIQNAIQLDSDTLLQSQNEELVAETDHQLSNQEAELPASRSSLQSLTNDSEPINETQLTPTTDDTEPESPIDPGSQVCSATSDRMAWLLVNITNQKRPCQACMEQKHPIELSECPCQHEYCQGCLYHLFRSATVDENLFPPRCCNQPIPLDGNQIFLGTELARLFRQKTLEFSVPNRTYCHNTHCGAFIPLTNYSHTTATCGECQTKTCTMCKGALHVDMVCPNDEQLQQLIQLAREQGWQRCRKCGSMVELTTGCNHMT